MYSINEEQLKNFSIDLIKNYEGCPDAMSFLKSRYGNETDDLRKRKADFVQLIEEGKSVWIINFFLNIMLRQQRGQYLLDKLNQHKYLIRNVGDYFVDYDIETRAISNAVDGVHLSLKDTYKKAYEKRQEIIKELKDSNEDCDNSEWQKKMAESQIIKAYLLLIANVDSNLTRVGVSVLRCIAEAKTWIDLNKDYDSNLKEEALQLIESIEFFEVNE